MGIPKKQSTSEFDQVEISDHKLNNAELQYHLSPNPYQFPTQKTKNRGTKSLTYQVNCQESTVTMSNYCNVLWSPFFNIMLPYIICMFCCITAILCQRNKFM